MQTKLRQKKKVPSEHSQEHLHGSLKILPQKPLWQYRDRLALPLLTKA
ncbi:MAG: hypothetical protein KAS66_09460 [Candidatus Omnitrophica bacterium]|nr:hypothetical protein [Candidatus Omnitrophota bacterium]